MSQVSSFQSPVKASPSFECTITSGWFISHPGLLTTPIHWLHPPTAPLVSREDSQNCRKLQRTPEECGNRATCEEMNSKHYGLKGTRKKQRDIGLGRETQANCQNVEKHKTLTGHEYLGQFQGKRRNSNQLSGSDIKNSNYLQKEKPKVT